LTSNGNSSEGAWGDLKFNPTDPESGTQPYKVSFTIPNDDTDNVFSFSNIPGWDRIGAFWITMEGFNHSPTKSYPSSGTTVDEDGNSVPVYPYPSWDVRIDNIILAAPAPVPVPGAVWLFGTGLLGLMARKLKTHA
jgi:hypothetical protein